MKKDYFPLPGDKAFVEGSSGPETAHLEWLKWYDDNIWALIHGYKEAADRLVDDAVSDTKIVHPDRFFFPVAYLYRHTLEIFLKRLIGYGLDLRKLKKAVES